MRLSSIDFASGSWTDEPATRKSRRLNNQPTSSGAVRLSAGTEPAPRHTAKLVGVLVFAAGGILVTTASTGTVTPPPRLLMASAAVQPPAFFYDDESDALAELAGTRESGIALPGAQAPLPGTDVDPLVQDAAVALADSLPTQAGDGPAVTPIADHPSLRAVRDRNETPLGATTDAYTVVSGDTLSGLLHRFGVSAAQMPHVLTDGAVKQYLSTLRIGQRLDVTTLPDGSFHSLSAKVGKERRVTIRRADDGFAVAAIDLPVEKERVVSSGTIEQSLYLAAEQADLKQSTIMELADIFQWELDFARDIRSGDQFSVVYDRLYREGRYIGDGDILAAEFIRGSKTYRAIRFTTDDGTTGYYSPDGRSKKRTFNRHPVDVVRITSKFNPQRMHPVLGQVRAHRGVDYGAPEGSPIHATADGVVQFAGVKGAYGNAVILRHGGGVDTLYAHMSKIDASSIVGERVRQGDVIGYVGHTGRVTGTHLHYEFRKNGVHVDPLLVELPAAAPLPEKYRADLKLISDQMIAQMRSVIPPAEQLADASE